MFTYNNASQHRASHIANLGSEPKRKKAAQLQQQSQINDGGLAEQHREQLLREQAEQQQLQMD